ncbi:MAG: hypothetical protein KGO94_07620 [Alphaproteobacteria bacterium]|nr:hypothetical protein [Alphaproteobacteria bacterium]
MIHRTGQLERWLDFKSFQVFKEAITYTALQFFTQTNSTLVGVAFSEDGEIGDINWGDQSNCITIDEIASDDPWLMSTGKERDLVVGLKLRCPDLGSPQVTDSIFQGLIGGADSIFHLEKVSAGSYQSYDDDGNSRLVQMEDGLLQPLISGPEIKRYELNSTNRHIIFPYSKTEGIVSLIAEAELSLKFPKTHEYLTSFKDDLQEREDGSYFDDSWYRFSRSQNLGIQRSSKLIVAQTVPRMRVYCDFDGKWCLNNVRVNGVVPAKGMSLEFLLGVTNSNTFDYVFRLLAKPKQGGWFEANKQFIAPLPVPKATPEQQAVIGKKARHLQEIWTKRRDLIEEVEARLSILPRQRFKAKFLWPDLPDANKMILPKDLREAEKTVWKKEEMKRLEDAKYDALQGFLDTKAELQVEFSRGELRLLSGGRPVLSKIFVADEVGPLVAQYWRYVISQRKTEAKTFAKALGDYPSPDASDAARQFAERVDELLALNETILGHEHDMNDALYDLYELSTAERQLIEDDCAKRPLL